jgi:broad specificity phosphatase PhoE
MTALILVKHAMPEIEPDVEAPQWRLSAAGRDGSRRLAERLREYAPVAVVTSHEPKAMETGEIVGKLLGVRVTRQVGLHEHERSSRPFLSPEAFNARMAHFFAHPDERVVGHESADEALARFHRALDAVVAEHPDGAVVAVAHGTVISLFVSHVAGGDPFVLWSRLGLPSYVVLSRPALALISIVESVGSDD